MAFSPVRNAPYQSDKTLFNADYSALYGADAYDTKQHFVDFITRFAAIVADNSSVSQSMQSYLATNSFFQERGDDPRVGGGVIGAGHFLFWLDQLLKAHKGDLVYTNRLSEAGVGWGSATPDNLTDADPLDLVTTLEAMNCNVAVVDPAAIDDGDLASADGVVKVTYQGYGSVGTPSNNPCTNLAGTLKTNGSSSNLFTGVDKDVYRYKLWSDWESLNEPGGSTSLRFPNSTKPCVILTRYAATHSLRSELMWRKPSSAINGSTPVHPDYIWVGGYPGELPIIRMGSSVDVRQTIAITGGTPTSGKFNLTYDGQTTTDIAYNESAANIKTILEALSNLAPGDISCSGGNLPGTAVVVRFLTLGTDVTLSSAMTVSGSTLNAGTAGVTLAQIGNGSGGANMVRVGNTVGQERNNVHVRNTEFWGNRARATTGLVYASMLFYFASTSSGSIRRCVFRKTQFIRPDDSQAGSYAALLDGVWAARSSGVIQNSAGVQVECNNFLFDENYVEPVTTAAWRKKPENHATFQEGWLIIAKDGTSTLSGIRVTRNTFRGVKTNSMIVAGDGTSDTSGLYIADNDMEIYDKNCIDLFNASDFTIERNRCADFGNNDYAQEGGGRGIVVNYCQNGFIQDNVVFNHETMIAAAYGIAIANGNGSINTSGIVVRRNVVYRSGIYLDNDSLGSIGTCEVYDNIVAGMSEARKADWRNAPINVDFTVSGTGTGGSLGTNLVYDNQIWRFANATPAQSSIETGGHISIRKTGGGDSYAVSDTLAGWSGNFTEKPNWTADPETDDFRLTTTDIAFADAPFTAAASHAWEP